MGQREVTANHDAVVNAGRMAAALMGTADVGTAAASRAAPHLAELPRERTPASTAA
jgi:hypothetical protein